MTVIDAGPPGQYRLAPSILSADFGRLAHEIALIDQETDWLHVDVMDGHFVPNVTFGPPVVASLRQCSSKFFDCHLMMSDPGRYLEAFANAGANGCTVHVEVGGTAGLIADAHALGLRVGLAVNPETPFDAVAPFLADIDLLVVMAVHPGFGGQRFISDVMDKVRLARRLVVENTLALDIEVDGGVNKETGATCSHAGANVLVAGSAIFSNPDPLAAAREIRSSAFLAQR